ncbi:MAG: bifunctional riboflavin kinase/FAD synthetase [Rickettsiales bacterium]|jgi:riboflavin kinase/FMN adenylyltransferase|nr:bifunctional riboflavin kinase/FAD synthetase [Rickettsiales bacterium]
MQIIRSLRNINIEGNSAIMIGNFDGIHLGHQEIIRKNLAIAKNKNLKTLLITFEPHPIKFLKPDNNYDFRITSLSEKLRILKDSRLDYVAILPFNRNLSEFSASDFLQKILLESFKMKHLTIGYDFIFGKNRTGNFEFLQAESKKFDFTINRVEEILINNHKCSSTIIRQQINKGFIDQANQLLNRFFSVGGIIIEGKKIAQEIGFPTCNIKPTYHIVKPKFGVYESLIKIGNQEKLLKSITNFGIRPTIENTNSPIFETHILNFNQKIYQQKATIFLKKFIREEKKFNNIRQLKEQVASDINSVI